MRSFYVYRAETDSPYAKSLGIVTSPAHAKSFLSKLADGEYNVRDCLGGLRMRVRVESHIATIVEKTK